MDTKALLVFVGVLLVSVGFGSWYLERDAGSSTVTERYTRAETVKESSAPAETLEEAQSSSDASPGTASSSSKRTMSGGTSAETIRRPATKVVTTKAKPDRSDTLVLGFVGLGCAFLFSGAFYDRISSIKFPGGEVTLVEGTKELEESVGEMKIALANTQNALKTLANQVRRRS